MSADNPIEILDEPDNADPTPDERTGTGATNPIAISDSDDDAAGTGEGGDSHQPPAHVPQDWPSGVPYWPLNRGLRNARFPNIDYGPCACTRMCRVGVCANAKSAVFCDDSNCTVGPTCGNRLLDYESLTLTRCIKGLAVTTVADIPPRTVVGEYCGYILPSALMTEQRRDRGFVLKFRSRSMNGTRVVIDAAPGGSLCRFVNHSCSPNCRFEERQHRATRRMVIVTDRLIMAGEEITVLYNKKVSFACLCGEANCQSKHTHTGRK